MYGNLAYIAREIKLMLVQIWIWVFDVKTLNPSYCISQHCRSIKLSSLLAFLTFVEFFKYIWTSFLIIVWYTHSQPLYVFNYSSSNLHGKLIMKWSLFCYAEHKLHIKKKSYNYIIFSSLAMNSHWGLALYFEMMKLLSNLSHWISGQLTMEEHTRSWMTR